MRKILLIITFSFLIFRLGYSQNRTDSVHVLHYDLSLSIIDFTNHTISGQANLMVSPEINNLPYLNLDLLALTVDSVFVNDVNTSFTHQNSLLHIPLNTNNTIGDTIAVSVYYHGTPTRDSYWGGFYYSGQYAYNIGVAFNSIPHNFGRCWFPCIDMFTDKSTYTFRIRTEKNKMAVCGGLLTDSLTLSDSTRIWRWELAEPIPTYLASVAVGEYKVYKDTFNGLSGVVPIEIYTPPSYINNVSGSFINLKTILRNYENFFGPHRFVRVGYVGVNFNSGAMEHATNIAYPQIAINGNLDNQSLYAHELSHSWFGNLITCQNAEEMWINEGFARYSEALIVEALTPDQFAASMRNLHRSVLKNAHQDDGGYYALNAVPQNVTYGTTSYDKGAIVVHTLRNYLGDSLFFTGIKSLLTQYAFQNISSDTLFSYISQVTGVPLMEFYEGWVNQPGFLHFSIDSIRLIPSTTNQYRVYIRQRLHQATNYSNNNRIDLTFFSSNRAEYTITNFEFSGQYGTAEVTLPFQPIFGVVDYHEKMADAIIDYNSAIATTGTKNFSDAGFSITVNNIADSILFRTEHNLVAPDPLQNQNPDIYRISDSHYWRIEYAGSDTFQGYMQFKYYAGLPTQLDYNLMQGYNADDLVLLYRRDASEEWRIIPFTRTGTLYSGNLRTNAIFPGEFTIGVGNSEIVIDEEDDEQMTIHPNPASGHIMITISPSINKITKIELLDTNGKIVKSIKMKESQTLIDISDLSKGTYLIRVTSKKGFITKKFINY